MPLATAVQRHDPVATILSSGPKDYPLLTFGIAIRWSILDWRYYATPKWTGLSGVVERRWRQRRWNGIALVLWLGQFAGKIAEGRKIPVVTMTPPGGRASPIGRKARRSRGRGSCHLLLSTYQGRIPRLVENATSQRQRQAACGIEHARWNRIVCAYSRILLSGSVYVYVDTIAQYKRENVATTMRINVYRDRRWMCARVKKIK